MLQRFRHYTPTLIGAALLMLAVDGFILLYRLIGLSRPTAVYAGLLTFVAFGSAVARRVFKPRQSKEVGEDDYA